MRINYNKPVKVYRNLKHGRKAKPLYSVMQNGRVVRRTHRILLVDAQFEVNEKGRQRVLMEHRKNVHAFVRGYIAGSRMGIDRNGKNLPIPVTYNPYAGPDFTADGLPVKKAYVVLLNEHGMSAAYID